MTNTVTPTFIQATADLPIRDPYPNTDLCMAAEKSGMRFLANGWLLCLSTADRDVENFRILCEKEGIRAWPIRTAPSVFTVLADDVRKEAQRVEETMSSDTDDKTAAMTRLELLVKQAVDSKASDIHLEIREPKSVVKFRILGKLVIIDKDLPASAARAIANVAFRVKAEVDYNPREKQQGSLEVILPNNQCITLRINATPVGKRKKNGADIVCRVLDNEEVTDLPSLLALGLTEQHEAVTLDALIEGSGTLFVAGPTGSGKTTTIASIMGSLPDDLKKYTIEDPIEKHIPGVSHIEVEGEDIEAQFDQHQQNLMRQDPDVAMVGEVRNLQVAETIIKLATTGHLAMATVHTDSAMAILTRLNDLGVSWHRLSDPGLLKVLLCQRLIGRLCDHCKIAFNPVLEARSADSTQVGRTVTRLAAHFDNTTLYRVNPVGCDHCNDLGYTDRVVVAEVIRMDRTACTFIRNGDLMGWRDHLVAAGWPSIRDHAAARVMAGEIDPFDADKIAGPFGRDDEANNFNYGQHQKSLDARKPVAVLADGDEDDE